MTNNTPLGLYVHWPYCARICPYCDFNVYKNREIDADRWADALTRDLKFWAAQTPGRNLASIYFGGGTPSLAPLSILETIINAAAKHWGLNDNIEITLEANPTDTEQSRFDGFQAAGVTRLSLGVQSLRDDALNFLGRDHDAAQARSAVAAALATFPRSTFDLIYGRPGQSPEDWRRELNEALDLGVRHLSLYQLTIEPGTAFHRQVDAGRWAPPDDEVGAAHFEVAQELTEKSGLEQYEISNFAAPRHQSVHNLIYWRYQDYIGVGPGAHGRLADHGAKRAITTHRTPESYLNAVEACGNGVNETEFLDAEAQLVERLTMGLRLNDGINLYADDPFYADDDRTEKLKAMISDGLIEHHCGRVRLTHRGRPLLNRIIYELLT